MHRTCHGRGDLLSLIEGDALGDEFPEDQRHIGDDQDHQRDAQRLAIGCQGWDLLKEGDDARRNRRTTKGTSKCCTGEEECVSLLCFVTFVPPMERKLVTDFYRTVIMPAL